MSLGSWAKGADLHADHTRGYKSYYISIAISIIIIIINIFINNLIIELNVKVVGKGLEQLSENIDMVAEVTPLVDDW